MRLNDDDLEGLGFFDSLVALGTKAMEVRSQLRAQRSAGIDAKKALAAAKARAAAAEAAKNQQAAPASSPTRSEERSGGGGLLAGGMTTALLAAGVGYLILKRGRGR